jgi:hypothetical protein
LLNEISGDLRQRVQHIKVVLGEEEDDEATTISAGALTPGPSEMMTDESEPLLNATHRERVSYLMTRINIFHTNLRLTLVASPQFPHLLILRLLNNQERQPHFSNNWQTE